MPPSCTARSSPRGRPATATRSPVSSVPTCWPSGCGGSTTSTARAGTTSARSAAARGRVPRPHQPRGRCRGPRRGPPRGRAARRRDRPRRQRHQAQGGGRRAHHARRVLDARPRRRRWILLSIEQDAEGAHHLDAPIVASPWSDDARMHDEAITELAVADAMPDGAIAGLVDVDYAGDARTQALDLSVVDGRFAPAVLEAAARRAVEAWAEAVDGADAALERAATPEAAHALLYPRGEETRLVVRGPRLESCGLSRSTPTLAPSRSRPAHRPPLPRGPRHRRRAPRLEGPRHDLHRALDARARRRPHDAVADRRDRRGGLTRCCSPSPTSPRAATPRRSTPSAPPS